MTDLNKETIVQLSRLCRIDCTDEEQEKILRDLQKILKYFEELKQIDTENVAPCNHVLEEIANVLREDEIGPVLDRESFLANAPSHIGGMVRVPPVIKQS